MICRPFTLEPFRPDSAHPAVTVAGMIGRSSNTLSIAYELRGDLEQVAISAPEAPERKDNLWEETCFEFFLAPAGVDGYREFNLSPSGHWNVYRFESYRSGMEEDRRISSLPFRLMREPGTLRLSLDVDLAEIGLENRPLSVGIAVVIRAVAGEVSYWALAHPGPQPDFHRKDGFVIDQA